MTPRGVTGPLLDDTRTVMMAVDGRITVGGRVDTFAAVRGFDHAWGCRGVMAVDGEWLVGLCGAATTDFEMAASSIQALDIDRLIRHGALAGIAPEGDRGEPAAPPDRCRMMTAARQ